MSRGPLMEFDISLITSSFPLLLQGALVTLEITAMAVGLGLVFGLVAALAQLSGFLPLRILAKVYVDFIRGTPLLVQIFIIYFALPVIIGQRIASVQESDIIILMDNGQIGAVGNHETLMQTCEEYRIIAQTQMGDGREDA